MRLEGRGELLSMLSRSSEDTLKHKRRLKPCDHSEHPLYPKTTAICIQHVHSPRVSSYCRQLPMFFTICLLLLPYISSLCISPY